MYYKRYELQWRLSLFFSASIIAGAVSGLLAYGIAQMDGVGGYGGWRWMYVPHLIPSSPQPIVHLLNLHLHTT